ncbi:MAG: hypothetical protein QXW47_02935 [Candidatus Jordarchaeales archaeon]
MSDDKMPDFDDLMKNLFDGLMGSMLQGISESFGKLAILVSSAESHGRDKKNTCAFYRNGVCDYWYWEEEPSGEPFIINIIKKGDGWYIDPHPIYCALCFTYEEKEYEEEELEEEELEDEWAEEDEEELEEEEELEGEGDWDEGGLEDEWAEEDEEE